MEIDSWKYVLLAVIQPFSIRKRLTRLEGTLQLVENLKYQKESPCTNTAISGMNPWDPEKYLNFLPNEQLSYDKASLSHLDLLF